MPQCFRISGKESDCRVADAGEDCSELIFVEDRHLFKEHKATLVLNEVDQS